MLGAHLRGIVNRPYRIGRITGIIVIQKLKRHDRRLLSNTCYTNLIVAHRTDDPGHMRSMTMVIHRIGIVIAKVPAMDVIDKPVEIVINTVAGNFAGVGPDVSGQIRVRIVHAGVNHGDDNVPTPRFNIPCFGGINIGVCNTAGLPSVMQAMLLVKLRVIGYCRRKLYGVRFVALKEWVGLEKPDCITGRGTPRTDKHLARQAQSVQNLQI